MPVTPMRRDDVVTGSQVLADPNRDRFLARIQMGEAGDLAGRDFQVQALLEFPDGFHLQVGIQQRVRCHGHTPSTVLAMMLRWISLVPPNIAHPWLLR